MDRKLKPVGDVIVIKVTGKRPDKARVSMKDGGQDRIVGMIDVLMLLWRAIMDDYGVFKEQHGMDTLIFLKSAGFMAVEAEYVKAVLRKEAAPTSEHDYTVEATLAKLLKAANDAK